MLPSHRSQLWVPASKVGEAATIHRQMGEGLTVGRVLQLDEPEEVQLLPECFKLCAIPSQHGSV